VTDREGGGGGGSGGVGLTTSTRPHRFVVCT